MTAATVTPTYSTTFYAGPPPPPTASTVRPEQQPPQLAYGWWVDVLPPRGPYLWPCNPDGYQITQPTQQVKHENNNDSSIKPDTSSSAHMDTTDSSSSSPSSFLSQPPQMAFGWYCAEPPRSGPFFWSCVPPGYQLVPTKQWEHMVSAAKNSVLTTTRQGNVTLTLPTSSASLAATLNAATAAAANTSSPSPSTLPSSVSLSDALNAPSSTLSLSNFYPASKTASISNLLASPPPPSSLAADSLSFLNLSQSQDDSIPSIVPPMPSRSPALEGLAAVAGEERGGGGSEFKLDSVGMGGGVAGASLGSVGESDEADGGGEDDESQAGLRRGKRRRTAKVRG